VPGPPNFPAPLHLWVQTHKQRFEPLSEPMDDFSSIINLLESAKQLASMNEMPMLAYLIDVAKCEARENKPVLRKRKRGESTVKQETEA